MYIKVKASFSDFEPGWKDDDELLSVRIPAQANVRSEVSVGGKDAADAAAGATSAATGIILAANVALSGSMSQVWGMINGMQLFVNLPLFDIVFPAYSQGATKAMITIATFDVMPTDDVFAAVDAPEEDSFDPKFESVGYEATSFTQNLGTMFLTVLVMLFIPVCLLAL